MTHQNLKIEKFKVRDPNSNAYGKYYVYMEDTDPPQYLTYDGDLSIVATRSIFSTVLEAYAAIKDYTAGFSGRLLPSVHIGSNPIRFTI